MTASRAGITPIVLLAGLITLLVTLLRLYGECHDWNPRFFSKEPGGQGAIVGISWLVVPFGFWFGRRIAQSRGRPPMGRAWLFTLLPIPLLFAAGSMVSKLYPDDIKAMGMVLGIGVPAGALLLLLAWPRAFAANLLYAVLARVPVIAVQYIAIDKNWGTHFEKVHAKLEPMDAAQRASALMQAQATFWIGYTVIAGGLCALLGALTVRKAAALASPL